MRLASLGSLVAETSMKLAASIVMWLVAAFYAYGALVHVLNMLGLSGFDWRSAPLKWQVLDVSYLLIDLLVVVGLLLRWRFGFVALYVAALSQILLYTVLREWIIDVPPEFAVSEEQRRYLTSLMIFHCLTLGLVSAALWYQSKTSHTL